MRLIDADAIEYESGTDPKDPCADMAYVTAENIDVMQTVDAKPVVRCKDCVYYHKAHIKRNDGTECDISEVPEEFIPVPGMCNSYYGINVGGKCEYDNIEMPYVEDKSVFRSENDFCSRGEKK